METVAGKMCGRPQRGASLGDRGGEAKGQRSLVVTQVRRLTDTSGSPAGVHLSDAKPRLYVPRRKRCASGTQGRRPFYKGRAGEVWTHSTDSGWGCTTYIFSRVVHLPLSGEEAAGERGGGERGSQTEKERSSERAGAQGPCPAPPRPQAPPGAPPTWASASMMSLMRGGPRASAPSMRT